MSAALLNTFFISAFRLIQHSMSSLLVALTSIVIVTTCLAETVPKSNRAPEVRLHGNQVRFHISMVREFPFVEGNVAGIKGKFMLDTGSEQALTINDHRVSLNGGMVLGRGFFGSGQTFEIRLRPAVPRIGIGPLSYAEATQVTSQDARSLENITPDFLGWIGYWFWDGYALKLDYQHSQATFYSGGPDDYLRGEQVIAELPFELRHLPNQPIMHVKIGSTDFAAAFDTGQYGTVYASSETVTRLTRAGFLTSVPNDKGKVGVTGLHFGHGFSARIPGLEVSNAPFAAAQPIGLVEPNIITLGYGFLRQYKTVWDFKRRSIYILKAAKPTS